MGFLRSTLQKTCLTCQFGCMDMQQITSRFRLCLLAWCTLAVASTFAQRLPLLGCAIGTVLTSLSLTSNDAGKLDDLLFGPFFQCWPCLNQGFQFRIFRPKRDHRWDHQTGCVTIPKRFGRFFEPYRGSFRDAQRISTGSLSVFFVC